WQTHAPYFSATEAELVGALALGPGQRLLEIGCGEGANLYHLGRRLPGVSLYGVDFSVKKAIFCAAQLLREDIPVTSCAADATRLPFADQSFDGVLIRDLLHHLPDRAAALR